MMEWSQSNSLPIPMKVGEVRASTLGAAVALVLLVSAVAVLVLGVVFSDSPWIGRVSPEAALWAAGGLALWALAIGLIAIRALAAKVAVIGALLVLTLVLLVAPVSFTLT